MPQDVLDQGMRGAHIVLVLRGLHATDPAVPEVQPGVVEPRAAGTMTPGRGLVGIDLVGDLLDGTRRLVLLVGGIGGVQDLLLLLLLLQQLLGGADKLLDLLQILGDLLQAASHLGLLLAGTRVATHTLRLRVDHIPHEGMPLQSVTELGLPPR